MPEFSPDERKLTAAERREIERAERDRLRALEASEWRRVQQQAGQDVAEATNGARWARWQAQRWAEAPDADLEAAAAMQEAYGALADRARARQRQRNAEWHLRRLDAWAEPDPEPAALILEPAEQTRALETS